MNSQIRAAEVRVIGPDGEQVGVLAIRDALKKAEEEGFDLVEVAATATPPVCRMMDYGRYRYEQHKKTRGRRKSQGGEQKELTMKPNIEQADYLTKLRHAKQFLAEGNRVKLTVRFRGRELAHRERGRDLLARFSTDLASDGRAESTIMDEGRNMSINIVPSKSGG